MRNAFKVSVGKPEGKRPVGKPRCRWRENIKKTSTQTGSKFFTFISTSPRSSSSNDPNVSKTAFVLGLTWILRAEKDNQISKTSLQYK
jgi:hypothetical protein